MKRAVITAQGIVAAQSMGAADFWSLLKEGRSAISPLTRFDSQITGCTIGGQVPDFSYDFIPAELKPKRLARHTVLLLKASEQIRSHLPEDGRFGIRVGVATSDSTMIAKSGIQRATKGLAGVSPATATQSPPHAALGALSSVLVPTGEVHTISTACAAGLDAIGLAARDVTEGRDNCILAGGTDGPLEVTPLIEFVKSGLASLRNEHPSQASRPFDEFADSGVLGEAAALVLVEELDHALDRGATILGEIVGYGSQADPVATLPGSGYVGSMEKALASAGMGPWDIDYISAWGPGHPVLDRAELHAIEEVFGPWADGLPISSIKGVIGNPLAAAGPAQVIAALHGLRDQVLPPTANLEVPLSGHRFHFVRDEALPYDHSTVLINAHGLGGSNSTLILRAWEQDS